MEQIEAKTILSKIKQPDNMFGLTYNMNIYRGCQHGCVYCDTRSECYQVGDISQIRIKKNAVELLRKEIRAKRTKGTIGTGSMNDPYMPVEKETRLVRKALGVIAEYNYPAHIITKSNLVTRDTDILQEISKVYSAVSLTITTSDDNLARKLEPNAPATSERFKALESLAKNGIYCGITLMPLLPHINDTKENIAEIIQRAKDDGCQYIVPMFGLTLRKGSREHFYHFLESEYTGMKEKYEKTFGEQYNCMSPHYKSLYKLFYEQTDKYGIRSKMEFYQPKENIQLHLF